MTEVYKFMNGGEERNRFCPSSYNLHPKVHTVLLLSWVPGLKMSRTVDIGIDTSLEP